jgi:hypothetical protein
VLLPEVERQQELGKEVVFRADAAFAKPEIYEALEERGVKYAIRLPANDNLLRDVEELLTRPVGRPSHKPVVWYKGFLYQAASWKTARRVVAKVEFHVGELFPRVGFIVTNLETPGRAVVRFYNKRGTAEQWIKEGKQAVKMTRLSCHWFRSNQVRLALSLLAYNLGNLWRRLGLPRGIENWSLTSSVRLKGEHLQLFRDIGHLGLSRILRKYLYQRDFLEQREAQNLQHGMEFQVQCQALAHDGHQHIDGDGRPDLCFHGVLGKSVEGLDAQVLLDPFEEQLHLPAALVQLRNGKCGQGKIVGEKDQLATRFRIAVADTAHILGIALQRIETHQADGLVATQPSAFVDGMRSHAAKTKVLSRANDEKRQTLCQRVEPREIQVSAIEKVEGAGFRQQLIEDPDFVDFGWFYVDPHRNAAPQIEQHVHLDGGVQPPIARPRKQRKTQIDGRAVQRIGGFFQLHTQRIARVQRTRCHNQHASEIGEDAPVARLVGIGQRAARDVAANAQVIQLPTEGPQTRLDVAQTLAVSELCKGHREKLVPARKLSYPMLASITRHTAPKFVSGNEIHQLREYRLARVHVPSLLVQKDGESNGPHSNRKQLFSSLNSYLPTASRKAQNTQPDTTGP